MTMMELQIILRGLYIAKDDVKTRVDNFVKGKKDGK